MCVSVIDSMCLCLMCLCFVAWCCMVCVLRFLFLLCGRVGLCALINVFVGVVCNLACDVVWFAFCVFVFCVRCCVVVDCVAACSSCVFRRLCVFFVVYCLVLPGFVFVRG